MGLNEKPAVSALLLLTAIFFINFFSRVVFSPLLPSIEIDLRLTHTEAGTIFLFISSGYFISLLSSGFVSSKLGHKKTILCSLLFISASLALIASLSSFSQLQTAFFLLGLGAGIYLPSAIATISELFSHMHWGKAFAIHELAPNLAFLFAPLFSSLLLPNLDWQHIVLVLAAAALPMSLLYHFFGSKIQMYGEPPNSTLYFAILSQRNFQILTILFSLGISSTIGIYNILPLFLVTHHKLPLEDANFLLGMSRILTIGTALLGGWLADRIGNRKTITLVLLCTGLTTCSIGLAKDALLAVLIFLQALLAVCFFPAGFALLARLASPETRNVVISLAIPLSFFIGGGFVPAMITFLADAGLFHVGIILAGLLILSGSLLVFFLRNNSSLMYQQRHLP